MAWSHEVGFIRFRMREYLEACFVLCEFWYLVILNASGLAPMMVTNRQQSCSYAVLTHNLWKLAKILQGQEKELQVA